MSVYRHINCFYFLILVFHYIEQGQEVDHPKSFPMKEMLNCDKVFRVLLRKDCLPVIFLLTNTLAISFLELNLDFQNLCLQLFNICECLLKKIFSRLNLHFHKFSVMPYMVF